MQPTSRTPQQPRYHIVRRLLFPYSGEEQLTRSQGLRVIIVWALFFSLALTFCSFPVTLLASANSFSLNRTLLLLLISFLSGVVVFGSLAWIVVAMSNRAARILQARKGNGMPAKTFRGGRYGS